MTDPERPVACAARPPAAEGSWQRYPKDLAAPGHTVTGNLRVFEGFYSPELGNRRDVFVYLPPSYEASTKRYAVLYMQDGQNLFDRKTSFADEWRVDDAMDAFSRRRGLEAIVVGVANTGPQRIYEYSPFEDTRYGGGKGDRYLAFLVDTLKPRVDRDFRTLPDRPNTLVAGSSMGGLISLYTFFRRPEVFGGVGVMSPSLWFADGAIFAFVEAVPLVPGRLYLDIGKGEGQHVVADARRMRDLLLRKGYGQRDDLLFVEQARAGHTERAWRRRFRHAVPFLLSTAP